jgi:hypothetical protein
MLSAREGMLIGEFCGGNHHRMNLSTLNMILDELLRQRRLNSVPRYGTCKVLQSRELFWSRGSGQLRKVFWAAETRN